MPLNVLIAPDKFKGTLTARAASEAIARGWRKARPKDSLTLFPISDGGDGFGEVISTLLRARRQSARAVDAAHRPCKADWWWLAKTKTAVIESANVIGLAMLPCGKFHPFQLDTFGLEAVVRATVKKGAKRIIIGIGGSATNDGGFGLARALGWEFLNGKDSPISQWTALDTLVELRPPKAPVLKKGVEIIAAVDVQNPLLGSHGATRIYGPQKGLRSRDFEVVERCLRKLAWVARRQFNRDFATVPGAGAAGGLGFGLMAFLQAKPQHGFDLFAKLARLSRSLRAADIVITGEGTIDSSTLMGKGAGEIAGRCRKLIIPCIALAGTTTHPHGINQFFSHVHALTDLTSSANAEAESAFWLEQLAQRAASALEFKP